MGACFPQDTMSQLNNSLHPQRVFTVASPPWSWLRAHPDCLYKPWHLLDLFASLISFAKKMTELFWKRRKNLDLFHWVSQSNRQMEACRECSGGWIMQSKGCGNGPLLFWLLCWLGRYKDPAWSDPVNTETRDIIESSPFTSDVLIPARNTYLIIRFTLILFWIHSGSFCWM